MAFVNSLKLGGIKIQMTTNSFVFTLFLCNVIHLVRLLLRGSLYQGWLVGGLTSEALWVSV